jgi:hypothetical protein
MHVLESTSTSRMLTKEPSSMQTEQRPPYVGSRFSEVWAAVNSDPYRMLPQRIVRLRDVLRPRTLVQIYASSRRTLRERNDLLPPFDKPVHPIGVCLRGRWRITEPSSYTGYFRHGSEGLLIARASDNMGETRAGRLRFLALAGKLYPTSDPDHVEPLRPANFVMNENLVGSHTEHYVDASLSTDLLPFRSHLDPRLKLPAGLLVACTFALADRATHITQSLRRQLYPIAQLGQPDGAAYSAPIALRLVPSAENRHVSSPDFREELLHAQRPNGIRYTIEVTDDQTYLRPRRYHPLGEIHFEEAVASFTGDHRLHFHHAQYRDE